MLRDLPCDTFKFLREAIDEFVTERWDRPIYGGKGHFAIDTKDQPKWYTLTQAKKIMHWSFRAMKEMVRSGAVLGYHLKNGHTLSVQNRPTGLAEDVIVLPCFSA